MTSDYDEIHNRVLVFHNLNDVIVPVWFLFFTFVGQISPQLVLDFTNKSHSLEGHCCINKS